MTEPNPATVADAIREQERADRDKAVEQELENIDKVTEALASDEDSDTVGST